MPKQIIIHSVCHTSPELTVVLGGIHARSIQWKLQDPTQTYQVKLPAGYFEGYLTKPVDLTITGPELQPEQPLQLILPVLVPLPATKYLYKDDAVCPNTAPPPPEIVIDVP